MDADEKLTALKKAYADVILSISKEAATRIMVSERRSVRYQNELKVAKDEGVRMLMRLKQMMDSQIRDAEAASLNQRKKIDELEAQLEEAEDIVRDLREELGEVQAELERVKCENPHRLSEPSDACFEGVLVENKLSLYQPCSYLPANESSVAFHTTLPYLNQRNECHKCRNKIVCTCSAYFRNRDLPSIILRGKDPGLYRNGCTHRIRACERNISDSVISEETDKVKDTKNDIEQKEGKDTSEAQASGAKIQSELEKKLLADIKLGTSQAFPQRRKRAVRRRKTISALGGKQSCVFPKLDWLPKDSVTSGLISVNDNANSAENPSKMSPSLSREKGDPQTQLGCVIASINEFDIAEIYSATMNKDGGMNEKLLPLTKVTGYSESLPSPDGKIDAEKVDAPSQSLVSNLSDTAGRLPIRVGERVIKYTFQRKRKRQALSDSGGNDSLGMEKKTEDDQNSDQKLEQPKPNLLEESSRDHRRLAQVARQLISLSEKKWWH